MARTPKEEKAAWRNAGYKGGFKRDGRPADKAAAQRASQAKSKRQMSAIRRGDKNWRDA